MKFLKAVIQGIGVLFIILAGNILTFTLFLITAIGVTAVAFWLIFQTLESPWLFIPIDLLLITALALGMRTETFRKALRDLIDQVKRGL